MNSKSSFPKRMGSSLGVYSIALDVIKSHNCSEILDCPSGPGAFTKMLLDNGYAPTCGDIDPANFQLPEPECTYCDMNVSLPFRNAQFDAVTCLNGLHRIWARSRCLVELHRVTKPGGLVIISFPNGGILQRLRFLGSGTASTATIGPPDTFDPEATDPATSYRVHLSIANVLSIFDRLDIEVVSIRSTGIKKFRKTGYKKGILLRLRFLLSLPIALLTRLVTLFVPKNARRRFYLSAANSWAALLSGGNIVITGRVNAIK